jgi:hypothetical protein
MQLDKTYIAVRERDYLEILDLALHVIQRFMAPLTVALLAGIVPLALASHYLFIDSAPLEDDAGWRWEYGWRVCLWAVFLAPLASAPATLLLGQALFMERVSARRIARDVLGSLPQLVFFQIFIRGALLLFILSSFIPFVFHPYLSEIILLERNPVFASKKNRITTMRRSSTLHSGSGGELFGRWLGSMLVGGLLGTMLLLALTGCMQWMNGTANLDRTTFAACLHIAVWTVVGYFTVVRFLSYLDLRIRREGWEVELKMRAEAARLQSELV